MTKQGTSEPKPRKQVNRDPLNRKVPEDFGDTASITMRQASQNQLENMIGQMFSANARNAYPVIPGFLQAAINAKAHEMAQSTAFPKIHYDRQKEMKQMSDFFKQKRMP